MILLLWHLTLSQGGAVSGAPAVLTVLLHRNQSVSLTPLVRSVALTPLAARVALTPALTTNITTPILQELQ